MKNPSATFILLITGFLLLVAGCNAPSGRQGERDAPSAAGPAGSSPVPETSATGDSTAAVTILFPGAEQTLRKGISYTLKWEGGGPQVSIFLIDSALETKGASVSISDRVYGIDNAGSYEYTIPERISEGTYKFMIGSGSSPYFRIAGGR